MSTFSTPSIWSKDRSIWDWLPFRGVAMVR